MSWRSDLLAHLTVEQQQLYNAISDVSEHAYAAGWMSDAHFQVWRLLRSDNGGDWGMGTYAADSPELQLVRKALISAVCWIVWEGDKPEAVKIDEWEQTYFDWLTRSIWAP